MLYTFPCPSPLCAHLLAWLPKRFSPTNTFKLENLSSIATANLRKSRHKQNAETRLRSSGLRLLYSIIKEFPCEISYSHQIWHDTSLTTVPEYFEVYKGYELSTRNICSLNIINSKSRCTHSIYLQALRGHLTIFSDYILIYFAKAKVYSTNL